METKRRKFSDDLAELLDYLVEHPNIDDIISEYNPDPIIRVFGYVSDGKEWIAEIARALAPCEKNYDGIGYFEVSRRFGNIKLEFNVPRDQVCTRKVVGTREVEVPEVPYEPARTRVEEIVEWECGPLLAERTSEATES